MVRWSSLLAAAALGLASAVTAAETKIDQLPENSQRCAGMYSRKDWGGSISPFVSLKFTNLPKDVEAKQVSVVIFEWKDRHLVGKKDPKKKDGELRYICDEAAVKDSLCTRGMLGEFLLDDNARKEWKTKIATMPVKPTSASPMKYIVTNTGYYCIGTYTEKGEYKAVAEFRGAYGELAASQVPKLPFYGALSLVYLLITAVWGFLYFKNRDGVVKIQRYISITLFVIALEMIFTWLYYYITNKDGNSAGSKALLMVSAVINAGRNSLAFLLLLIVSMGYGIVHDSLGPRARLAFMLTGAHFLFSVAYTITSLTVDPNEISSLVLLVIIPLAGTMTTFYVWTLNSIGETLKYLGDKKQNFKRGFYRRIWWCLLGSIVVIFGFLFMNSVAYAGTEMEEFAPTHWKSRWFVLDGWLNLVFLFDVCFIAWLLRPTGNNRRMAMSEEVATDFDDHELGQFHPNDSDSDLEDKRYDPAGGKQHASRSTGTPVGTSGLHPDNAAEQELFKISAAESESGDSDDENDGRRHFRSAAAAPAAAAAGSSSAVASSSAGISGPGAKTAAAATAKSQSRSRSRSSTDSSRPNSIEFLSRNTGRRSSDDDDDDDFLSGSERGGERHPLTRN